MPTNIDKIKYMNFIYEILSSVYFQKLFKQINCNNQLMCSCKYFEHVFNFAPNMYFGVKYMRDKLF